MSVTVGVALDRLLVDAPALHGGDRGQVAGGLDNEALEDEVVELLVLGVNGELDVEVLHRAPDQLQLLVDVTAQCIMLLIALLLFKYCLPST